MENPKISIVIPVYNGEKYINETVCSILAQTFSDYELLCIDDCSGDDSYSIIKRLEATDSRIVAIRTEKNHGAASGVLNIAKELARGDYFVYASQDDFFSPDWLQEMFTRAVETNADAVLPDVVFFHAGRQKNNILSGYRGDRGIILSNKEAVIASLELEIPGFALWRLSLVKKIGFDDFCFNADEYSVRRLFLGCNKIAFSGGVFYYRQDNENAITKKISLKSMDAPYTYFRIYRFLKENDFSAEVYLPQAEKAASCLYRMQDLITANMVQDAGGNDAQKRLESIHSKVQSIAFSLDLLRKRTPKSFMLCATTFNILIMRWVSETLAALKRARQ